MDKLLKFQKVVSAVGKDSTNPFFKSKYFDINKLIEVVKPALNEAGLVIAQPLTIVDGKLCIRTLLIDSDTSATIIESLAPVPESNDPQKTGSAITYFRRYALQSMLCLQADDDDANTASNKQTETKANDDLLRATTKIVKFNDIKDLAEFWQSIAKSNRIDATLKLAIEKEVAKHTVVLCSVPDIGALPTEVELLEGLLPNSALVAARTYFLSVKGSKK